ncbi:MULTISPECIES: TetR/AcrR family transcriptional regulator [unclassified Rhodococcus (in: high G+C Gram-positive bacteria)]|uniref:TetR/AcrR family transcriptional regulator n=1 Tax=unclassified Rhodococcus (in: high G+C Gram-positive bacteria) TaxID=192944 RepID=UPI0015C68129|nr:MULTISPECIES: TetR/AcrR family transcriptional regulator [unclassified Rhodococcus (in: high G+C Gram-positive bacteria)]
MTDSVSGSRPRRLTTRGAATKARIVDAADQLMYERGVASTTLADVRAASETSKSQLYQHFAGKRALVLAVVEVRADAVLSQQRRRLERIESFRGLELWRDCQFQKTAARCQKCTAVQLRVLEHTSGLIQ